MSDTKPVDGASYLWFGGKDGWQLTSFHPSEDPAIGWPRNDDVHMYVPIDQHAKDTAVIKSLRAENAKVGEELIDLKHEAEHMATEADERCARYEALREECAAMRAALERACFWTATQNHRRDHVQYSDR